MLIEQAAQTTRRQTDRVGDRDQRDGLGKYFANPVDSLLHTTVPRSRTTMTILIVTFGHRLKD